MVGAHYTLGAGGNYGLRENSIFLSIILVYLQPHKATTVAQYCSQQEGKNYLLTLRLSF